MILQDILKKAIEKEASDIYFKVYHPPVFRISGDLYKVEQFEPLSIDSINESIVEIAGKEGFEEFKKKKEMDKAYLKDEIGRFRVNMFYQKTYPGMVMRRIKEKIGDFHQLNLPESIERMCDFTKGIILVCGPARSGKSTTVASMLEYINSKRKVHIITLEDPIEYMFKEKRAVIDQREVGLDTESFETALKHVMRQDPDVIFIGELRDKDTFHTAINAAETGHLVITTLHAHNAKSAIQRILNYYPINERDQIRTLLSGNLCSITTLNLIYNEKNKQLMPMVEVLNANIVVRKIIAKNKLDKINPAIELGTKEGMQSFNQSLINLIKKDLISEEEASKYSPNPETLKLNLKGIYLDDSKKIIDIDE